MPDDAAATPDVRTTDDPQRALNGVEAYLGRRPVAYNLAHSLLAQRMAQPQPGRYWTAMKGGDVVGFALQSPRDVPLVLAATGPGIAALAESIHGQRVKLPGVTGEAGPAAGFAGAWSEHAGVAAAPVEGQRMYRLGRLRTAEGIPGRLRPAAPDDTALVVSWREAFHEEVGGHAADARRTIEQEIAGGRIFVWDDDGAVCVARATRPVAGVSRIGFVYTPPGHRRRGYAAGCVGALCEWVKTHDAAGCMLFTQLDNPTSNAIYRRLGFEAVAEALTYRFGPCTNS